MIIYPDTEKELSFDDYKPVNSINLKNLSIDSLKELQENIENALDNAYCYHSELLSIALDMDYRKVNLYIRMKELKAAKQAE